MHAETVHLNENNHQKLTEGCASLMLDKYVEQPRNVSDALTATVLSIGEHLNISLKKSCS
jgi:hypothetical protein